MKKFYLLFISVMLFSCSSTLDVVNNPEPENPNYTYLALGDSYTIGESVIETQRWPVQLVEQLRARGYKMAPPKIIAKTGWTTQDLLQGIDNELSIHRDFDLVSILIGVNNQYQGKLITEYEEDLRTIFRKAINHSKTKEKGVFAVSIPDYGYTPFGAASQEEISAEIDRYNAVFRRVAADFNVPFYNITPISREAKENPDLVASDDLHPSGLMYKYWVDQFVNQVAEKLPE
ncbi:lysophospholipase L1-like esterase [Christiangramia gaetbulicola]|uniref:Lysophospholipase L1-like esterase n=1 Tax=Christiangramia gaetbulicola TaxID=703340 RepID=A0A2T6AEN5_9FLAO|nr:SGNH/GDSL hydrolase family protein [Christiangramia gaetbulicola]PTX42259.1 lysophospholipase L1-like esterase [Christiangramia gaetbulicola]